MNPKFTSKLLRLALLVAVFAFAGRNSAYAQLKGSTTYIVNGQPDLVAPLDTFVNLMGTGTTGIITYLNANGTDFTTTGTITILLSNGYTGVEPTNIVVGNTAGTGFPNNIPQRPILLKSAGPSFTITTSSYTLLASPPSLFRVYGISHFTVDGDVGGQRNITFRMTNTTAGNRVVDVIPLSALGSQSNVKIQNVNIVGSASSTTPSSYAGIYFGGLAATTGVPNAAAISQNSNISYINNYIIGVQNGILHRGAISAGAVPLGHQDKNITIRGNIIGDYVNNINVGSTATIGGIGSANGIYAQHVANSSIDGNTIRNCHPASSAFKGIQLAHSGATAGVACDSNVQVVNNKIYNLITTSGAAISGIYVDLLAHIQPLRLLIANNSIAKVMASGAGGSVASPATYTTGISINDATANNGLEIFYNSINLFGDTLPNNGLSTCIGFGPSTVGGIIMMNNSFTNTMGPTLANVNGYAIYGVVCANTTLATAPFTYSNFNNYFVNTLGGGNAFVGYSQFAGGRFYSSLKSYKSFFSRSDTSSNSAIPPHATKDTVMLVANGVSHSMWNRAAALDQFFQFYPAVYNAINYKLTTDINGANRTGLGRFSSVGCHFWAGDSTNNPMNLLSGGAYVVNGVSNPPTALGNPTSGSFASLAEAITHLNAYGVSGSGTVTITITNDLNEQTWLPAVIDYPGSSVSLNTVIRLGAGRTDTIAPPNRLNMINSAVLRLNGARFLTIDGNATRGLTIMMPPLATQINARVVAITPFDTATRNVTIQNCVITGNSNTSVPNTYAGIYVGQAITPGYSANALKEDISNITIKNNLIQAVRTGIHFRALALSDNVMISHNIIGGTIPPGTSVPTTYIGGDNSTANQPAGIYLKSLRNSIIDSNVVRNCVSTAGLSQSFRGIDIDESFNTLPHHFNRFVTLSRNFIYNLVNNSTTLGTAGIRVYLNVKDTFRDIAIVNNHISKILSISSTAAVTPNNATGIVFDGAGITNGYGFRTDIPARLVMLLHNTINMNGNFPFTSNGYVTGLYIGATWRKGVSMINNVIAVTANHTVPTTSIFRSAIVTGSATNPFSWNNLYSSDSSNNNNYFVVGKTPGTNILANTAGTLRNNLSAWRTYTNTDALSFSWPATFKTDTTPDIDLMSAGSWFQTAAYTGLVCNDIYGMARLGCPNFIITPIPSNRSVGAVEFGQPYAALAGGASYQINGLSNPPLFSAPTVGSFKTVREAVDYLNGFGVDGSFGGTQPIKFVISGPGGSAPGYQGETDTFYTPITVKDYSRGNPQRPIWLTVAAGRTDTIRFVGPLFPQANTSLIRFDGAQFFGIDGSNNGTSSKNLYILMPGTMNNTTYRIIDFVGGVSPISNNAPSCNNNTIKNCYLIGNSIPTNNYTYAGIYLGGITATPSNVVTGRNNNNSFVNNYIGGVQFPIYMRGTGVRGTQDNNNLVSANIIGGEAFTGGPSFSWGGVSGAAGITSLGQNFFNCSGNIIRNNLATGTAPKGIDLGVITGSNTIVDSVVTMNANQISNISTTTGGTGAYGIYINMGTDANNSFRWMNITNNMVSGIASPGSTTLMNNPFGIAIDATTTNPLMTEINLFYNSVNMGPANTLTAGSSAALAIGNQVKNIYSANNIFQNRLGSAAGTNRAFAVMTANAVSPFMQSDNNNYYVNAAGSDMANVGSNMITGTPNVFNSWPEIVSFTGYDTLSINFLAPFIGDNNLFIGPGTSSVLYGYAKPLTAVSTDINGTTRSFFAPTVGAHEFTGSYADSVAPRVFNMSDQTLCVAGGVPITLPIRVYDKNLQTDTMYYRINGGSQALAALIYSAGVDRTYLIPGQSAGSLVEFRVSARDFAVFPAQPNVGVYPMGKLWDTLSTGISTYPYVQSFEGANNPPWISQTLNNNVSWVLGAYGSVSSPALGARTGTKTANFNAATMTNNSGARLVSPCFNFQNLINPTVRFWVSQNNGQINVKDSIAVKVSAGGNFWSTPLKGVIRPNASYPSPDWMMVEVCLSQYAGYSGIRIGFEGWAKGSGNNFIIDDIMVFDDIQTQTISPSTFSICYKSDSFNITVPTTDSRLLYQPVLNGGGILGGRMGNDASLTLPVRTLKTIDTMNYSVVATNLNSRTLTNITCSYTMPTSMRTYVDRYYNGPFLTNGTPFQGSYNAGIQSDPDGVTIDSTITYKITPPAFYTNADYGTKWSVASYTLRTPSGATNAINFSFTAPVSGNNGYVTFRPSGTELDSTFILRVTLRLLNTNCDSMSVRYIRVAPIPPASFSVTNTTVCALADVVFQNTTSSSGNLFLSMPYTYLWNFGDGTTSIVTNPTKQFSQAGTYVVRLTVTNRFGLTGTTTTTITVLPAPTVSYTNVIPCHNDSTMFTANSQPTGSNFAWRILPSNTVVGTDQTFYNRFTKYDTAYQVRLTVTNSAGCANSYTKTLFIFAKPVANFTTAPHCQGVAVPLTNTSSIPSGNIGHFWDWGNGSSGLSAQPTYTFPASGQFTIKLRVTSSYGCSDSITRIATIYGKPFADFTFTKPCVGDSTIFTNNTSYSGGADNVNYLWDFGDNLSSTLKDPKHGYGSANQDGYVVWLRAQDKINGCRDSVTKTIVVLQGPVVGFTIPNPGQTTVPEHCTNVAVGIINNSFTPDFSPFTCLWVYSGTSNPQQTTDCNWKPTWTVPGNETVTLIVTNHGGQCQSTLVKQVKIISPPQVKFSAVSAPWPGSIYTVNNVMNFTPTDAVNSGNTYRWEFGDQDNSTSGKRTPEFTFNKRGSYKVKLIVTTPQGCISTYDSTVEIQVGIGVNEVSAGKFNLSAYPNPFSTNATVAFTLAKQEQVKITVTDILGREISSTDFGRLSSGKHEVVLTENQFANTSATYLLKIQIGDEVIHQTMIKQ